jgi:hypothetical protein
MGPRVGPRRARSSGRAFCIPTAFCSVAGAAPIFVTTARNMYCASRRRRSGKGVGLVVPTLLTWSGSAIVHDIKGENWRLSAGWRARFGRVLLFDAGYRPSELIGEFKE